MLTQVPVVMHMLGADFTELYARPHVFDGLFPGQKKNKNHNEHPNVNSDLIRQIPEALADPVAVFSQNKKKSLLFMLELKDANKATVVVPVMFNRNIKRATVNLALTAYSKDQKNPNSTGILDGIIPDDEFFSRITGNALDA